MTLHGGKRISAAGVGVDFQVLAGDVEGVRADRSE